MASPMCSEATMAHNFHQMHLSSSAANGHITVNPYHPQANGLAEKFVQIVKRLLTKAKEAKSDPYLSLLEYRNTIIDSIATPAQLLMSRRLKSVLPILPKQLTPKTIDPRNVSEQLNQKQLTRKQYYDKGSKPLSELQRNDPVLMQTGNRWIPATVMQKAKTPHSYIVKTRGGQTYRRNRRHLKRSFTRGEMSEYSTVPILSDEPHNDHQSNTTITSPVDLPQPTTSSGRPVKTPARFHDYVKM